MWRQTWGCGAWESPRVRRTFEDRNSGCWCQTYTSQESFRPSAERSPATWTCHPQSCPSTARHSPYRAHTCRACRAPHPQAACRACSCRAPSCDACHACQSACRDPALPGASSATHPSIIACPDGPWCADTETTPWQPAWGFLPLSWDTFEAFACQPCSGPYCAQAAHACHAWRGYRACYLAQAHLSCTSRASPKDSCTCTRRCWCNVGSYSIAGQRSADWRNGTSRRYIGSSWNRCYRHSWHTPASRTTYAWPSPIGPKGEHVNEPGCIYETQSIHGIGWGWEVPSHAEALQWQQPGHCFIYIYIFIIIIYSKYCLYVCEGRYFVNTYSLIPCS